MNIEHIRYVQAIASMQSLTKAASILYISQPTLSKALNSLEAELGVTLFDRSQSPITLTPAGRVFLENGSKILTHMDALLSDMAFIASGHTRSITFGTTIELGDVWLPRILPRLRESCPDTHIEVIQETNDALIELLQQGKVDLVYFNSCTKHPGLDYEILGNDAIELICGKSHPLTQLVGDRPNDPYHPLLIPASAVQGYSFLTLLPSTGMGQVARQILRNHQLNCPVSMSIRRHETIVRLVAAGEGLAFSSLHTPERTNTVDQLCYFTLDDPLPYRQPLLVTRNNIPRTPEILQTLDITRSILYNNSTCISPEEVWVQR